MTLPKNIDWSTDDNFAAGANPWSSTPTKTEPSAQFKAEGFKPEKPIPANVLNWLLNQYGVQIEDLNAQNMIPVVMNFDSDGSFLIPVNALPWVIYDGYGGGGAGGHGGVSAAPAAERPGASVGKPSLINAGGGGGGGAIRKSGVGSVVPNHIYNVTVGAGGVGTDGLFGFGNPGADTKMYRSDTGDVVATCRGAQGGQPPAPLLGGSFFLHDTPVEDSADAGTGNQNNFVFSRGGRPVRLQPGELDHTANPTIYAYMYADNTPQSGGLGTCATWPFDTTGSYGTSAPRGNDSPEGFLGGNGGTPGAHYSSAGTGKAGVYDPTGGGAGGGGGAGPGGNGGNGGNGSAGVQSGASAAPDPGTDAAANSGAGGGGGGGAGGGHVHTTIGGSPGNGGSGHFRVIYFMAKGQP